jgi:hypothetical protein
MNPQGILTYDASLVEFLKGKRPIWQLLDPKKASQAI